MRLRVAPIFRTGFVALVVACFVLFLTLWIRSMSVRDVLSLGRGTAVVQWHGQWARSYRLDSGNGRLALVQDNTHPEGGMGGREVRWTSGAVPPNRPLQSSQWVLGGNAVRQWHFLGFGWDECRGVPLVSSYAPRDPADLLVVGRRWVVPYWAVVIPAGIATAIWVRNAVLRYRERRRVKRGLCLKCGYDLRASKERCPECGTAIAADSAAGCETKAI